MKIKEQTKSFLGSDPQVDEKAVMVEVEAKTLDVFGEDDLHMTIHGLGTNRSWVERREKGVLNTEDAHQPTPQHVKLYFKGKEFVGFVVRYPEQGGPDKVLIGLEAIEPETDLDPLELEELDLRRQEEQSNDIFEDVEWFRKWDAVEERFEKNHGLSLTSLPQLSALLRKTLAG